MTVTGFRVLSTGVLLATSALAAPAADLSFEKQRIGTGTYEAGAIFDVNNDGKPDLVSGEYWHPGPDFTRAVKIADIHTEAEYYDDFSNYPLDVNGDGYLDVVSGGWFNQKLVWRENPKGAETPWPTHDIATTGNVERACFWDIDGDGNVEVVPNLPNNGVSIFSLKRDAAGKGTGEFSRVDIYQEKQGHGLGFGDLNGDGRGDLVLHNGWLEAPAKPFEGKWTFHPDFDLGEASVPVIVYDVNTDGKMDLISGNAHGYGLAWYEQGAVDGKAAWTKHDIETDRSQFHELALADLNKDGGLELITGKRYRAHNDGDPGAHDPVGLYYYPLKGGTFTRHVIDYGDGKVTAGTGIYLWVADADGNGWNDILAPGKGGIYLLKNQGPK